VVVDYCRTALQEGNLVGSRRLTAKVAPELLAATLSASFRSTTAAAPGSEHFQRT
jgi:hypothetical protein